MKSPDPKKKAVLYLLVALLVFVFVHGFVPHDDRVRMGFKSFHFDFSFTAGDVWFSLRKWKHVLWFALFDPALRFVWPRRSQIRPFLITWIVSILIEFQQGFVAGREARLTDILPNLIGASIGFGFFQIWSLHSERQNKKSGAREKTGAGSDF